MNASQNAERLARCRRIAEGTESVPEAELRAFPQLCAREIARAEARRKPVPQLPLPEAA